MAIFLWICAALFIGLIVILTILSRIIRAKSIILKDAHVVVTGGSSGIGKAMACRAVLSGANVTLVARDESKLDAAKQEVEKLCKGNQKVQVLSVDLTSDYETVKMKFDKCQQTFGAIKMLVNCAGGARPGRFDEVPVGDFKKMLEINYLSGVHATRAVLPCMKSQGEGRIVFVSSQAGQIGLFGFTAYSASKFALRGLAESLQMEVKPYNIYLTLAFPPDTDTPGLAEESKYKPEETQLISETAGLFTPEYVASTIMADSMNGRFFCSIGLDGIMLSNLTSGFSPVTSIIDAIQQVLTMGIFRIVSLFYLYHFDKIVRSCKDKRDLKAKVDIKKTC